MPGGLPHISCLLLDIEGTVCSISFVRERLFPYAIRALPEIAAARWDDPDFKSYVTPFPEPAQKSAEAFADHAVNLMHRDSKLPYLKRLQGYLWKTGWATGAFVAPLYPDVLPELRAWHAAGKQIAIFSSGSIDAQKLLFGHVGTADEHGVDRTTSSGAASEDVNGLMTGYFDTQNAGPKQEAASYEKIAKALAKPCREILFLSDNVKEVSAAREAGMESMVIDRPGNEPLSDDDRKAFTVQTSFKDIALLPKG